MSHPHPEKLTIAGFQRLIEELYGAKDRERGTAATFQWFTEEVGELARAIRKGNRDNLEEEFADCLAWLSTLASMCGVELDVAAIKKYPGLCHYCRTSPCSCPPARASS